MPLFCIPRYAAGQRGEGNGRAGGGREERWASRSRTPGQWRRDEAHTRREISEREGTASETRSRWSGSDNSTHTGQWPRDDEMTRRLEVSEREDAALETRSQWSGSDNGTHVGQRRHDEDDTRREVSEREGAASSSWTMPLWSGADNSTHTTRGNSTTEATTQRSEPERSGDSDWKSSWTWERPSWGREGNSSTTQENYWGSRRGQELKSTPFKGGASSSESSARRSRTPGGQWHRDEENTRRREVSEREGAASETRSRWSASDNGTHTRQWRRDRDDARREVSEREGAASSSWTRPRWSGSENSTHAGAARRSEPDRGDANWKSSWTWERPSWGKERSSSTAQENYWGSRGGQELKSTPCRGGVSESSKAREGSSSHQRSGDDDTAKEPRGRGGRARRQKSREKSSPSGDWTSGRGQELKASPVRWGVSESFKAVESSSHHWSGEDTAQEQPHRGRGGRSRRQKSRENALPWGSWTSISMPADLLWSMLSASKILAGLASP